MKCLSCIPKIPGAATSTNAAKTSLDYATFSRVCGRIFNIIAGNIATATICSKYFLKDITFNFLEFIFQTVILCSSSVTIQTWSQYRSWWSYHFNRWNHQWARYFPRRNRGLQIGLFPSYLLIQQFHEIVQMSSPEQITK